MLNQTLSETKQLVVLFDKMASEYAAYSIGADVNVSDYNNEPKAFKERWLTLPWKPWVATKAVYRPCLWVLDKDQQVIVSPRTYKFFKKLADNTGVTNA